MSLLRGLPEIGIKAAKKTAPFYSAVDDALSNLKRPKGTGIEFLTEVMKTKGVKKAEIADRKLEQAFKAKGKMTKEEAQEVLKENPPPQIKEKVYDESTAIDEDDLREMVSQEMFGKPYSQISFGSAQHRKISDEVYKRMDADNGTTYGRYRTPDGENYREILLKLPVQGDDAKKLNEISMTLHGVPYTSLTGDTSEMAKLRLAVKREYRNLYGESGAVAEDRAMYRSNHWKDDANVLAHMRVQDRKGPNGEKILHVEEIQSDWHQAGRKKGYKPDDYVEQSNALEKEFKDLVNKRGELRDEAERIGYRGEGHRALVDEANSITPRLMQLQEQRDNLQNVINYGVPEAPFKKNWHELAMKRLLNYAAENGYDSIAITPGAEQAKRYDLSKQISRVVYSPDTEMLNAFDSNNKSVVMHSNVKPDQVADYIGKEPAQRLFDEQNTKLNFKGGKDVPYQEISGIDLQVGGEGMKGFYDKILPDYLNTFGKPYGAQMGTFSIPGDRGATVERLGVAGRNLSEMTPQEVIDFNKMVDEAGAMKLHSFPITPEMRESIKQKGLPLYQQIGIPTAGAGAASQMLEPQEEPQYGTGGAIAKMALKAAPPPRSPQIIKPSTLTELKKVVQQEKGGYGARRLERAADEVPNLEKLYQEKALREAFTGDNAKALMTMNPADFEKYAAKLFTLEPSQGVLPQGSSDDYLNYLRKLQGFRDVPFLEINKREQGTPVVPYISGHEGRHRSRAMTKNDETSSLVRLLPRSEMREPFPRRSQEEYIEALKEELALTGNKVKPENYTNLDSIKVITRPPIDLPDIYAKGGAVKPQVKKSVSGKVKMTDNRDAMFMELSNNKLKRK
jgi:hypothetical protein